MKNDCQTAFDFIAKRDDSTIEETPAGPRAYIRRKLYGAGQLSDGARSYTVAPCERWRWLVVTLGWDTIAEIDQRRYFERPADLAAEVIAAIDRHAAETRAELT